MRRFLDLEVISYQKDDVVVKVISDAYNKLKAESLQLQNTTFDDIGLRLLELPNVKSTIKTLEEQLSERFGWKFKFIYSPTTPFATIPVAPRVNNALGRNFSSLYEHISKSLGTYDINKAKKIDDQVAIIDKQDERDIYAYTKHSFDVLSKALEKDNIIVDNKNARIEGLPSDYVIYYLFNPMKLIRDFEISNLEFAAILLHEVGHNYTFIEYSYRTAKFTTSIFEAMEESVKKGSTTRQRIKYISKKASLDIDVTDKNETESIVALYESVYRVIGSVDINNVNQSRDAEQLADQFATRFGLGKHLSSSLDKLKTVMVLEQSTLFFNLTLGYATFYAMFALIIGGLSLVPTVFLATFIVMYALKFIGGAIINFLMGTTDSHPTTYDDDYNRIRRIKVDLIRVLRLEKELDQKAVNDLIESIDGIERLMKGVTEHESLLAIFGDYLPYNSRRAKVSRMERKIETITENSLYVHLRKLQN